MLWEEHYRVLKEYIEKKNIRVDYNFESSDPLFERLKEQFKDSFVEEHAGNLLGEAEVWTRKMKRLVNDVIKAYGLKGVFFSKEFASFLEDPRLHLKKKLFNYVFELLRGKIELREFERSASAAIKTSIRTNMRTTYQNWAFLGILYNLKVTHKARIVYPEIPYLPLERSGRQRSRSIPPNMVLRLSGGESLSFFLEAPRPVSWEDSEDLKKYWSLYVTLRPDLLIYSGELMDILEPNTNPPIKRPDVIVEFKELKDWYLRVREVRGPLTKPLSAEEWRSRWLEGLWSGLSEILGVERRGVRDEVKSRRGVVIREDKVIVLYKRIYNPKVMTLVSKHKVPRETREYLRKEGITVIDNVGFKVESLKEVVNVVLKYAYKTRNKTSIELSPRTYRLILEVAEKLGLDLEETIEKGVLSLLKRV